MVDDQKTLFRLDLLEAENKAIKAELASIEKRNEERDAVRSAQERRQLIAGVMFLGGMVSVLGGIIWQNLSTILARGAP